MPATERLRRLRLLLWLVVALAAIGLAALLIAQRRPQQPDAASSLGIGGPFTLVDSAGKPFSSTQLAGRPHAIFFGFTNCPDVCPTTLARLVRLRRTLARVEDSFAILFITVDPERDSPAAVGRYAALFRSPVIGLTGTPAQIDRVRSLYGAYAAKAPLEDGGYSMDHTAAVYLFDRAGGFAGTIAPDEGDQPALDKLRRIIG